MVDGDLASANQNTSPCARLDGANKGNEEEGAEWRGGLDGLTRRHTLGTSSLAFPSTVLHAAAVFEKTGIARAGTDGSCKIQGVSHGERSEIPGLTADWAFATARRPEEDTVWSDRNQNGTRLTMDASRRMWAAISELGMRLSQPVTARCTTYSAKIKKEEEKNSRILAGRVLGGREHPAVRHHKILSMQAEDRPRLRSITTGRPMGQDPKSFQGGRKVYR